MLQVLNGYDSPVQNDGVAGDRPLSPTGWGGARPGAGAPLKAQTPEDQAAAKDRHNLTRAKGRHETIKADLAELEYRERVGELVLRAAVQKASATMLATLAQSLRTIPDTLERKYALKPEVTAAITRDIDDALDAAADLFEMMAAPPAAPAEPDTPEPDAA